MFFRLRASQVKRVVGNRKALPKQTSVLKNFCLDISGEYRFDAFELHPENEIVGKSCPLVLKPKKVVLNFLDKYLRLSPSFPIYRESPISSRL